MCLAAPYWVEKPISQDVAENDTGTFRCRGEGIPEPSVKWLINGIPVTSEFVSLLFLLTHAHKAGKHYKSCTLLIQLILNELTVDRNKWRKTFQLKQVYNEITKLKQ